MRGKSQSVGVGLVEYYIVAATTMPSAVDSLLAGILFDIPSARLSQRQNDGVFTDKTEESTKEEAENKSRACVCVL